VSHFLLARGRARVSDSTWSDRAGARSADHVIGIIATFFFFFFLVIIIIVVLVLVLLIKARSAAKQCRGGAGECDVWRACCGLSRGGGESRAKWRSRKRRRRRR